MPSTSSNFTPDEQATKRALAPKSANVAARRAIENVILASFFYKLANKLVDSIYFNPLES